MRRRKEEFVKVCGGEDFTGAGGIRSAFKFSGQVQGGFMTESLLVEFFVVVKPFLVAVGFPSGDIVMGEAGVAEIGELLRDLMEGNTIIDPVVYGFAQFGWKAGDFAVGTADGDFYRRQRR